MRCNPWRWLWGLIPIAMLSWVAVHLEQRNIETDLSTRSAEALSQSGFDWATPGFSGRDGIVVGRATDDIDPQRVVETVAKVWGVRTAAGRLAMIEKIDPYLWSATWDDYKVVLGGFIPNENARKAIVTAAQSNFPKSEIVDEMRLARGVPDREPWLGGIDFGLAQLASLKRGKLGLSGLNLSIEGEAEDPAAFKRLKTALATDLPAHIVLASENVTPPYVSPYTWAAHSSARQVVLSGHVPNEKERVDLFAYAKKLFPASAIVDRMETAAGAPEGWSKAAGTSLKQLAQLNEGTAEMRATQLTLSGEAADEATAQEVTRDLRSHLPSTFNSAENITFPAPVATAIDEEAVRRQAEEDAKRKAEEEAKARAEEVARLRAEEDATRKAEEEAKRKAEEEARAAAEVAARRQAELAALETKRRQEADACQQQMQQIATSGVILFEFAKADLDAKSAPTLRKLAAAASACPNARIEIAGHTDAEGLQDRNQGLSELRARSVVDFLISEGVESERLSAVGYGEARPVAPNDTPANRAKNRRIEFKVRVE